MGCRRDVLSIGIICEPSRDIVEGRPGWESLGFDYEDRLTGIGSGPSYSYIGASTDRFSKTVSGTTTLFLYDGSGVSEEMQGSTVTAVYSAGAEKLGSTIAWMLQDGQGSTRQFIDSSAGVTDNYTNDAYGNSIASSGS